MMYEPISFPILKYIFRTNGMNSNKEPFIFSSSKLAKTLTSKFKINIKNINKNVS